MIKVSKDNMVKIAPLFDGWDETLIWSCLQGCTGFAYTDDINDPKSAKIISADFAFLAGIPNGEILKVMPNEYDNNGIIIVPQSTQWEYLIEKEFDKCKKFTRYAIKKEPDVFNREQLQKNILSLDKEFTINKIDEKLYEETKKEEWSKDFCEHFSSYEDFNEKGLGFVVTKGDELVSGASSYSYYNGGIEIEIDTKVEYQRQGLALACASKLILECLDKGLYPSWDAYNMESVKLAEKLGYHFDHEYTVYEVCLL